MVIFFFNFKQIIEQFNCYDSRLKKEGEEGEKEWALTRMSSQLRVYLPSRGWTWASLKIQANSSGARIVRADAGHLPLNTTAPACKGCPRSLLAQGPRARESHKHCPGPEHSFSVLNQWNESKLQPRDKGPKGYVTKDGNPPETTKIVLP